MTSLDYCGQRYRLLHQKHAWAMAVCLKEVAEVPGHGPEIGSHKHSILLRSQSQNIRIRHSFQAGVVRR